MISSDKLAAKQTNDHKGKEEGQKNLIACEDNKEPEFEPENGFIEENLWVSSPGVAGEENQDGNYGYPYSTNLEPTKEENLSKSWNLPNKTHGRIRFGPLSTIKEE